jgi:hypothetical protein
MLLNPICHVPPYHKTNIAGQFHLPFITLANTKSAIGLLSYQLSYLVSLFLLFLFSISCLPVLLNDARLSSVLWVTFKGNIIPAFYGVQQQ